MSSTAEQMDARCSEVGAKLHDLTVELHDLHDAINFGPELSEELDGAFRKLGDVVKLVDVASNLYPYPTFDE